MDSELRSIHEHMLGLGLGALAHSTWHAHILSPENDHWFELSVIQAAHAAELLIKARIAQEHPLLIFENLPRGTQVDGALLTKRDLIENGRTYQYADLPDRLWATTGIKLPNRELYRSFGRLRNAIQHFAPPDEISPTPLEFIFGVIDPFINDCWGLFAVDYNEDYEPYIYLVEFLVRAGIQFLVSPQMVEFVDITRLEWPQNNAKYKTEIVRRFSVAKKLLSRRTNSRPSRRLPQPRKS